MTLLRQRMLEDMRVRNLAENTQRSYVQHVSAFARHFDRSPEELGPEEIRVYQVYLTDERKLAPASVCMVSGALRFLYHVTLKRGWVETEIPLPKKPFKLPVILSPEEIMCFLECVHSLKMRTLLRTTYAAGLRVSEANPLQGCGPSGRRAYGTANRPRHQRHVRKTGRATRLERLQGTPPAVLI